MEWLIEAMSLRFEFKQFDGLPRLAWCARLESGVTTVTVKHGSWVETNQDFFVEGAWDGQFEEGALDQTLLLMGSGGRLVGNQALFATPCHTLERLQLVRRGSSLFVSNSLPFVLAEADLTLHPRYSDYQSDLWSIVRGLGRYVKHIPTRNGPPVRLFYHGNIVIGPDLEISEQAKVSPPRWNGFAEYRSFLVGALAGLRQNATAPQRHVSYDLLSSISSGYDSPAAAALAAEIGCSKAVSFKTGTRYLHDGSEVEDSGVHIARALGLEVQEFARATYLGANSIAPAEFAACGDSFDLQLAAFEGELVQKLFLTGFGGDVFWDRWNNNPNARIARRLPPSGDSVGEFRLRVGFVHIPVPFLGAVGHPAIHAISNSPEMRAWMLDNDYDRPIPRRILEQKAVPRLLFGQSKKGSFAAVTWGGHLQSCKSFEDFYQRHRRERNFWRRAWAAVCYLLSKSRVRWTQTARRLGLPALVPVTTGWDVRPIGRRTYVVAWGSSVLQERYRVACHTN